MRALLRLSLLLTIFFLQPFATELNAAKPIIRKTELHDKIRKDDPPKKNKLAKWSLILSGSGFLLTLVPYLSMFGPYLMVGGIVCGIIALTQIKKTKEKGSGMAIASLILGGVFLIAVIIAVAVLLSIFN
ncbi:MAG: DUF4190 domain-containing protein [Chitinophagia bacterium]|jgi:hypothetical protein